MFFFEKKNQKTFIRWRGCTGGANSPSRAARIKVFWFFFSKKNVLAFYLACWPAHAATLRSQSTLATPDVHLADLFDDAGAQSDRVLGPAPTPGNQLIIEAAQLAAIARRYGVDWRPASGAEHVMLERPGHPLPRDDAIAALRRTLPGSGASPDCDIDLQGFAAPMIPTGSTVQADAEQIDFDAASGRFTATLMVSGDRMTTIHIRVTGRAESMIELPVPTRRILPGELLAAADVHIGRVRGALVRTEVAETLADTIGQQARHNLAAGQPIQLSDIQHPAVVRKNAIVVITLISPGMAVSAIGQALDSGPVGGHIRVRNPLTRNIIDADITGPDRVTVVVADRTASQLAAR